MARRGMCSCARVPTRAGSLSTLHGHEDVKRRRGKRTGEDKLRRRTSLIGEGRGARSDQIDRRRCLMRSELCWGLDPLCRNVLIVVASGARCWQTEPGIIGLRQQDEGEQEVGNSRLSHGRSPIQEEPRDFNLVMVTPAGGSRNLQIRPREPQRHRGAEDGQREEKGVGSLSPSVMGP